MPQKLINVAGIGEVVLQKRKGARHIRLTVSHDGITKVSLPSWSPYHVGEAFARSKADWIAEQQAGKSHHLLGPNQRIGKNHRLRFIREGRSDITARVTNTEIVIRLPINISPSSQAVQTKARTAAIRALKRQAVHLLTQRLMTIAQHGGFSYRTVAIKRLKSRWGSCSSRQEIALNCFLMQLPWDLIDYVILHELVHTRIMAHGKPFWDELEKYVPDLKAKRQAIRSHQPTLVIQA